MRESLIYIVNQLKNIAYEDLTKAELNILRSATKALGWTMNINVADGKITINEK